MTIALSEIFVGIQNIFIFLNDFFSFRRDTSSSVFDSMATSSTTEDDILISSTKTSKVLSSYTLDLKSVITNNVDNIIDFQFLHGYTQPTLAILYEPLQTFVGRIAVRKDTCRLGLDFVS